MNCPSTNFREHSHDQQSSADGETRRFRAVLWEVAPLDIIQLACLRNARTSLFFLTPERTSGTIFIDQGRIVHAECGLEGGMRALATILSWRKGEIQEFPEWLVPVERTIDLDWQLALMEASHVLDEGAGQAA
jgi:two-component system chemotaxis response regulator CheB